MSAHTLALNDDSAGMALTSAAQPFDQLLSARVPHLLRVAHARGLDDATADDAVQQTLISAWRHRDQLRSPEHLNAWIDLITENLHAPVALFGVFGASLAVGAIAGALGAAWLVPKLGDARSFSAALLGASICAVVYPRLESFAAAIVLAFAFGICEATPRVAAGPLLFAHAPRALLGRVSALAGTANLVAVLVGSAAAGCLASTALRGLDATILGVHLGAIDAVLSGAGIFVFVAAIYAVARIGWRDPVAA